MNAARRARLAALADLHDMWVTKNAEAASSAFDPKGRPEKSVYNQHHVDLDADGAAQDRYAAGAARVLAAGNQTAAYEGLHEFCRNPLHPGPCKGWKNTKRTSADTAKKPTKKAATPAPNAAKPAAPAEPPSPARGRRRPPSGSGTAPKSPSSMAKYTAGEDMLAGADPAVLGREIWDQSKDFEQVGDDWLHVIASRQGFDGVPEVVSKAKFGQLARRRNSVRLHRGVEAKDGRSAADLQRQFRTGAYYGGLGFYGNGIYSSTDEEKVRKYSDGTPGSMLRMLLRPEANVVDLDDLMKEYAVYSKRASRSAGGAVFQDPGRYAAARGYDAIRRPVDDSPGETHYIVLNRTALFVEEADHD